MDRMVIDLLRDLAAMLRGAVACLRRKAPEGPTGGVDEPRVMSETGQVTREAFVVFEEWATDADRRAFAEL